MLNYPTSLPIDETKALIAAIKDGKLKENRQNVAKDLWVLQGYILNHALGEPHPDSPHLMQAFHWPSLPVPPTKEILPLLEKIIGNPDEMESLPIPSHVILKWLFNIGLEMV